MRDMRLKGRSNAVLTQEQVNEVINLRASGLTHLEISKRFNLSRASISNLLLGKNYKHLSKL